MEEWMSLRAYGRHRGVTLHAVQKAIETSRVTAIKVEGGRTVGIERYQADAQWAAHTDAAAAARNGTFVDRPAPAAAGEDGAPAGGAEPAAVVGDFLAARIREAEHRGDLLELEKLERIGALLPRAEVRRVYAEIFAQLRSAAFRIPDRKAQALASETDSSVVHRVLSAELRQVFYECSRQLEVSAAGVADDSGVGGEREAVLP